MVGPSSSHTAGAVRIGYIGAQILEDTPQKAVIYLHGSFATTGTGHGTDRALIAGILGMMPDDIRIPQSFEIAKDAGMQFSFYSQTLKNAHPNTALLELEGRHGKKLSLQAASIGGGRIRVTRLDGIDVDFSAEKPTLIICNEDRPGLMAEITRILAKEHINIATIKLNRDKRGGNAVMVIEMDTPMQDVSLRMLEQPDGVKKVIYLNPLEGKGTDYGI